MKTMNIVEAKHYLAKKNVSLNLWDIKQDITKGRLHAKKSNGIYWIAANDLETAYGISQKKLTGREYFMLRSIQGQSKNEIIQRRLLQECQGDTKSAERIAAAYEAHITMGTYQKQIEADTDIGKHFALLGEADNLVKKLSEKHSLGLIEEVEKIEQELMKNKTVLCKVMPTDLGIIVQLPLTSEKQRELGLYKSVWDFFSSHPLYTKLQERGIKVASSSKDGYIILDYAGKQQQIINTLQEHLTETRPQGFPEARLELKLYVPPELSVKKEEAHKKIKQADAQISIKGKWYTADEVRKSLSISSNPQKIGGLVNAKVLSKPRIVGGIKHYQVLKLPN